MKHHLNLAKAEVSRGSGTWLVSDWDKSVSWFQRREVITLGRDAQGRHPAEATEPNHGDRKALER